MYIPKGPSKNDCINFTDTIFRQLNPAVTCHQSIREKNSKSNLPATSLFQPVPVKSSPTDLNVGAELTGILNKSEIIKVLGAFAQKKAVKDLALKYGLDGNCRRSRSP